MSMTVEEYVILISIDFCEFISPFFLSFSSEDISNIQDSV